MRAPAVVSILLALSTGCAASAKKAPPTAPSPPIAADGSAANTALAAGAHANLAIPRVIRRIVVEERELVDRSLALVTELPDARGRGRAETEARTLSEELGRIEARVGSDLDSAELDETVTKLILLDTRISLLHESLRTATNRTSAVVLE